MKFIFLLVLSFTSLVHAQIIYRSVPPFDSVAESQDPEFGYVRAKPIMFGHYKDPVDAFFKATWFTGGLRPQAGGMLWNLDYRFCASSNESCGANALLRYPFTDSLLRSSNFILEETMVVDGTTDTIRLYIDLHNDGPVLIPSGLAFEALGDSPGLVTITNNCQLIRPDVPRPSIDPLIDITPAEDPTYGWSMANPIRFGFFEIQNDNLWLWTRIENFLRTPTGDSLLLVDLSMVDLPREADAFVGASEVPVKHSEQAMFRYLYSHTYVSTPGGDTIVLYTNEFSRGALRVPVGLLFDQSALSRFDARFKN